eukprot:21203-Heterococcus_DN1.PRE.1
MACYAIVPFAADTYYEQCVPVESCSTIYTYFSADSRPGNSRTLLTTYIMHNSIVRLCVSKGSTQYVLTPLLCEPGTLCSDSSASHFCCCCAAVCAVQMLEQADVGMHLKRLAYTINSVMTYVDQQLKPVGIFHLVRASQAHVISAGKLAVAGSLLHYTAHLMYAFAVRSNTECSQFLLCVAGWSAHILVSNTLFTHSVNA